jgi:hypothetical protein
MKNSDNFLSYKELSMNDEHAIYELNAVRCAVVPPCDGFPTVSCAFVCGSEGSGALFSLKPERLFTLWDI